MRGRTHQLAPNCAAKQETRAARALFPKNTISRSVDSRAPNAHFDDEPDQRSRVFRSVHEGNSRPCWASECRPEMLDYPIRFRNATGAVQPIAERVNIHLMDFNFFTSTKQPWHRPRCCSQANESAASNSPSKNAWRTSSHSGQGLAVLVLDSGIMTVHRLAERKRQPAPGLTMTFPFMFGWIEHK
jgi:hypothetical protein